MSSFRHSRRRKQTGCRHRMMLEVLEKRYALNAAPILDPTVPLTLPISFQQRNGDAITAVTNHNSVPVSDLIGSSAGNYTDADGDSAGIAITGVDANHGRLLYTTDAGESWTPVGPVSPQSALLLSAAPENRLAFQAHMFELETQPFSDGFSFKAWDGTDGRQSGEHSVDTTGTSLLTSPVPWATADHTPLAASEESNLVAFARQPLFGDGSLEIYDFTSVPVLVGTLPLEQSGVITNSLPAIFVSYNSGSGSLSRGSLSAQFDGDYLYVLSGRQGDGYGHFLSVVDLSVPSLPRLVGTAAVSSVQTAYFVSTPVAGKTFIATNEGLRAIDLTDPTEISVTDIQLEYGSLSHTNYQRSVAVSGEHGLVFTLRYFGGDAGISVYSLDTQAEVYGQRLHSQAGTYSISDISLWFNEAKSHLYVSGRDYGVIVYEVAADGTMTRLGLLPAPANTAFVEALGGLQYDQSNLAIQFRGPSNETTRYVYDISGGNAPLLTGRTDSFSTMDSSDMSSWRNDVLLAGQSAMFSSNGRNGHVEEGQRDALIYRLDAGSTGNRLAFSVEEARVNIQYTDTAAEIFGADNAVLTVGRSAQGEFIWKDRDSLRHPEGTFGRFLTELPQGEPDYLEASRRVEVVSLPMGGDVTVLNAFRSVEMQIPDGYLPVIQPAAYIFTTRWNYEAGSSFTGTDAFVLRFFDEVGGFTDKTITVTGQPSRELGLAANMVILQNGGESIASYTLPVVGVDGEALTEAAASVTVTSSDQSIIPHPTAVYGVPESPSYISFAPVADASGTVTISIQVEDGGADNDLSTVEDNGMATHQIRVKVLELISEASGIVLSKDEGNHIYAATQPIMLEQQQAPSMIKGFAAIGAEEGNVLLVERSGTTHRLVTDDGWRISNIFDSLRNYSSTVLRPIAREPVEFALTAVPGAYVIDSLTNPTLTVHRGQKVTFDLNVIGHPYYLQTTGGGYVPANVYTDGFSGNGQTSGRYEWIVPEDAPDELFYQCEFHPVMFGKIVVVD